MLGLLKKSFFNGPFLKRGQETAFFREHILFFGVKIKDNSAQTTKNGGIVHAAEKYFQVC